MRDQHRPKQELINEVAGLRKQVADLKEAMTARRRVEDALRAGEEQVRTLADGAPVGLCLFQAGGSPVAANEPFARLLGYTSPAELLRLAGTLGVFSDRDEQRRVFDLVQTGEDRVTGVIFRRKDGSRQALGILAGFGRESGSIVVAVLEREPEAGRAPTFAALGSARSTQTRSAS
jgi:PAS domain S-box-containing protein